MSDIRHQMADERKRQMGYEDLKVYEKSYKSALSIYRMTESFPKEEIYGLTSQIRRAATSIPLNIAEGYAKRESQAEFKRYLTMALGSSDEMQVLLNFVKDLGYVDPQTHKKARETYKEIAKMLNRMVNSI